MIIVEDESVQLHENLLLCGFIWGDNIQHAQVLPLEENIQPTMERFLHHL